MRAQGVLSGRACKSLGCQSLRQALCGCKWHGSASISAKHCTATRTSFPPLRSSWRSVSAGSRGPAGHHHTTTNLLRHQRAGPGVCLLPLEWHGPLPDAPHRLGGDDRGPPGARSGHAGTLVIETLLESMACISRDVATGLLQKRHRSKAVLGFKVKGISSGTKGQKPPVSLAHSGLGPIT